ncbi:MAG: hypothetical protein IJY03_01905 [Prevotella sp.]|nr:hypothetical protein [Prevotella sp.]
MRLRDMYPQSVLMESSDYHDRNNSRSFICVRPMAQVAIDHGKAIITLPDSTREERDIDDDCHVHDAIRSLTERISIEGEKAECCGGRLANLDRVFHGIATEGTQLGNDYMFNGLPRRITMGRYHSWVVSREYLPDCLEITAESDEGHIMALRHRTLDIRGLQFHPESVLTTDGREMMENWIKH